MKPLKTLFANKRCNLVIQDNPQTLFWMVILGSVFSVLTYNTVSPGDKMLFMNQGVMFDTVRSVNINSVMLPGLSSRDNAAFCGL